MIIELEYDDELMHGKDQEAIAWFYNDILLGKTGLLTLHSNEIGDQIGSVECISVIKEKN